MSVIIIENAYTYNYTVDTGHMYNYRYIQKTNITCRKSKRKNKNRAKIPITNSRINQIFAENLRLQSYLIYLLEQKLIS